MTLKWMFPPTGGGVEQGFNDSGQEHFRADSWENAIREMIQNSLDAVRDRSKPVTVDISTMDVPSSEIGADALARHMEKALEYTKRHDEIEGTRFYKDALKILDRSTIYTLAIKDANTTGLVGNNWDALIHREGTPNKRGMDAAGGSFGIGKNAPYLVSALKTVCYSTRYLDRGRQEAFIARCKISAHRDPNSPHDELQHIGFGTKVGVKRGYRAPPTTGKAIYGGFRLSETGSGVFIVGFDPQSNNWANKAKRSIAHNFFAAIHERKLQISIESEQITHETLDELFEADRKAEPTRHYYHIMRDPDAKAHAVNGQFGNFTVQFSVGEAGSPNTMAYVNRRGMLVTDAKQSGKNPFHTTLGVGWASYAAVVRAADDKTDAKIRRMEPPTHRAIEHSRIRDPEERYTTRTQLGEIREQIAKMIDEEIRRGVDDELNLSELADIMPMDEGEGTKKGHAQNTEAKELSHRELAPTRPKGKRVEPTGGDGQGSDEAGGAGNGGGGDGTPPTGGGGGAKNRPRDSSFGRIRVMRNRGKLRVSLTPKKDAGKIRFIIKPAGEDQKRERVIRVAGAEIVSPREASIGVSGNSVAVGPTNGSRIVVDLAVGQDHGYTGYEIVEFADPEVEK